MKRTILVTVLTTIVCSLLWFGVLMFVVPSAEANTNTISAGELWIEYTEDGTTSHQHWWYADVDKSKRIRCYFTGANSFSCVKY